MTSWTGMKDINDFANHIMSLRCLQGHCDVCNHRAQVSPGTDPGNSGTDPLTKEQQK